MIRKTLTVCLTIAALALASAAPLSETSLYNLESRWSDQNGTVHRWADLRGEVRVVALIYTHCRSVCPAIVQQMKETEARLSPAERKRVAFLLVSMDPEADTSDQLRHFAENRQLGPNWLLLRGKAADVRELASTLDFKYRKNSNREFSHSAMITLLDADGEIVDQQLGLGDGSSERLRALSKLLAAPSP